MVPTDAVMADILAAAAHAAIDAGVVFQEDQNVDNSKEQFDAPLSMSRAELRSMRDTLGLGLARMALLTRCTSSTYSTMAGQPLSLSGTPMSFCSELLRRGRPVKLPVALASRLEGNRWAHAQCYIAGLSAKVTRKGLTAQCLHCAYWQGSRCVETVCVGTKGCAGRAGRLIGLAAECRAWGSCCPEHADLCMRLNRTPATEAQVRCAILYLRCHDAPAKVLAEMRLPQVVAELQNHPTP